MKTTSFLIIIILFLSCGTDKGSTDTYVYSVRNKSERSIKIKAYLASYPDVNPIITNLSIDQEIIKKYNDGLPPRGYSFKYFFGTEKYSRDSLVIIYDNLKVNYFTSEDCSDIRNPLNICEYGNLREVFVFVQQDYEKAEDCNGKCE